ncbi:MAG: nucleotidyltransferase family protein [Sphingomonas bacterium]|nr:nucleotidyltransferase family protein [Sphingomonas bacterium]
MTRPTRAMRLRPAIQAAPPRTAMVMAAGLGTRMRPLTATRPKPLVEVAGKALIDHVFDRLRAAGVEQVVVNVHYLADVLEAHLAARDDALGITISDERALLLETGGGLIQAAPMIAEETFLVVNSDNYWIDGSADSLRLLASHWREADMDALLLLIPHARASNNHGVGDFHMDAAGHLRRRGAGRVAPFVFTGIQIVSKRLLRDAPGGAFSTNILWDRAIEEGRCFGAVHQGLWFDVGTPPAIAATEAALIHG